ncbi:MAG: acetate--CoA ligase family protein, partial [Thermomicrobiales bacterium]|nr:acetate--CoA ligase family protein [Thermomicrobiales bacterium]
YPRPRRDLAPLLRPRSIARAGASATPGSFGHALLRQALDSGFAGAVFPVNPTRADIDGVRCYSTFADLPGRVDCAVLAVGDARLEESLRAAIAAGIPTAVIFGAMPDPESTDPLPARLRDLARDAGLALLGGNCMGYYNAVDRLYISGYPVRERAPAGGIAFISHSGSAFSAMANSGRDFRFSWVISPGQELAVTAADYLGFLVEQPETRAVGLFLESVRDPEGFVTALEQAAAADVPVAVLKTGRSEQGRRMALAHSGALAGSDAAFSALCERWGVLRVDSLDEMGDALELLAAPRRVRPGGLALGGDSGGERAMIVDRATALDVPWAALGEATLGELAAALEPGLQPGNPLDMWGTGKAWQASYERCLTALTRDPAVGATVLAVDLVPGSRLAPDYIDVVLRVQAQTGAPMAVLGNMSSTIDRDYARRLRDGGAPVLMGTDTGLRALGHALRRQPVAPRQSPDSLRAAAWASLLEHAGGALDEVTAKQVLRAWGIPTVAERLVMSEHEAVQAASALGWPVVLKSAAPGLLHKSDAGGVRLHLQDVEQVAAVYADLRERFGPPVVVQPQIDTRETVELFLGMSQDPEFGPLLSVGLGGIWVEALEAVTFALPPVDDTLAGRMLDRIPGARLLDGGRGRAAVSRTAVIETIVAFSRLAFDLSPLVAEIDVNPLLAGPCGVVAVDAVIVPVAGATADLTQGEVLV